VVDVCRSNHVSNMPFSSRMGPRPVPFGSGLLKTSDGQHFCLMIFGSFSCLAQVVRHRSEKLVCLVGRGILILIAGEYVSPFLYELAIVFGINDSSSAALITSLSQRRTSDTTSLPLTMTKKPLCEIEIQASITHFLPYSTVGTFSQ